MIRGLFIAVFAFALPAFAETPAAENTVPATDTAICPMVYMPATCTINYGGEDYVASGTNSCVALSRLVQQVRDAALWYVDPANDVVEGALCVENPE